MDLRYTVVFERDEDGWFLASVPALGCAAQGRSRRTALKSLRQAVDAYVRARRARGWAIPSESERNVASIRVAV